jgi:hypothetical protein
MKQQNEKIDFRRFIDLDEFESVLEPIKGVSHLLSALEGSDETRQELYSKECFNYLQIIIEHSINKLEQLKPRIEYMGDFMRYETVAKG